VYGMTGGQLAPTTLMGQKTTTSPHGRDRTMGQPLHMAEMVAQLEGPRYVERVALFDSKQRARAAKAIEKALWLQAEDEGFAFVEVLAECPTHLRMSPVEAERWVKERIVPVFPLGVKKEAPREDAGAWPAPDLDPDALLQALDLDEAAPARSCSGFPQTPFVGWKHSGLGHEQGLDAIRFYTRLKNVNVNLE